MSVGVKMIINFNVHKKKNGELMLYVNNGQTSLSIGGWGFKPKQNMDEEEKKLITEFYKICDAGVQFQGDIKRITSPVEKLGDNYFLISTEQLEIGGHPIEKTGTYLLTPAQNLIRVDSLK